jgi:hypothetical protein
MHPSTPIPTVVSLPARSGDDEERKPATGVAHRDGSVGTPVDLRTLPGSEVQLEIDRPLGRPNAAIVTPPRYLSERKLAYGCARTILSISNPISTGTTDEIDVL